MAEAQEDRNLVKCPICLEQYVQPRKMANCRHSFCEACIVTYVSSLMECNEADEGFCCPLCKSINPAPKGKSNISVWVKALEFTGDNMELMKSGSGDSNGQKECDSCHAYGISTRASKICLNCFELFCLPCSLGRHSGRLYRNHKVVALDGEHNDSTKKKDIEELRILNDYSFCSVHFENPIEFYCKEDDCLCCAECVVMTHRKCGNVTCLKRGSSENYSKVELEKTKNMIDTLDTFARNIIDTQRKTEEDIKSQNENVRKTLQDIRSKINSLLDAVDEVTFQQTNAISKHVALVQEKEIGILNEAIDGLQTCSSLVNKAIVYGSASHYCGISQKVRDQIKRYKAVIMDACDRFETVKVDLKVESALQNLLDIGPNDPHKLAIVTRKCVEGDISTPPEFNLLKKSIVKTTEKCVRENYTCNTSPTYSDLIFLRNGRVVLIDADSKYCCLTNTKYKEVHSFKLPALSRLCFKDGTVVVSASKEKKIYFLSADQKLKVVREITTRSKPGAIRCLLNGDIAVAWTDPVAFGIISDEETPVEKTHFCQDKAGRVLKSFDYLAVDEVRKHVIQPCKVDKAIYCFDYEGNPKFQYASTDLSSPRGVALDWDGNIYLCSNFESVIHVVSPTGVAIRIIKDVCPKLPIAIAFKKNGEEFAVTRSSEDGRVVTFFNLQTV